MEVTLTIPDSVAIPAVDVGLLSEQHLTQYLRQQLQSRSIAEQSQDTSSEFSDDPYFIQGFHDARTFQKGVIHAALDQSDPEMFADWEKNQEQWLGVMKVKQ